MKGNITTDSKGPSVFTGEFQQIFKNEIIPILQHYPENRGFNSFMKLKSLCYQNQTKILKGKNKEKIY